MPLFRCEKKADTGELKREKKTTRRIPQNVPYVVDNLWEWARPEGYPSRRFAVCGSPTPEASGKSAIHADKLYRIDPPENALVVQLKGIEDAKFHPDCKSLKRTLTSSLTKMGWTEKPLEEKRKIAPLWAPGLTKEEVESLFSEEPLMSIRNEIWNAVTFWKDLRRLDSVGDLEDKVGEIFFEADEWILQPVDEGE